MIIAVTFVFLIIVVSSGSCCFVLTLLMHWLDANSINHKLSTLEFIDVEYIYVYIYIYIV